MREIDTYLALIIGVALSLLAFKFDANLAEFFKNIQMPFFGSILSAVTNFGAVVIVMLVIPTIILYRKNKKGEYILWASFFISLTLTFIIKLIAARQRPVETFAYPFTNIINYSFPSMHAVVAFSLMAVLNKNLSRQKTFWTAFAFVVAFSRLYFGVHFLSDVVFGALLGCFIGHCLNSKRKRNHGKNK